MVENSAAIYQEEGVCDPDSELPCRCPRRELVDPPVYVCCICQEGQTYGQEEVLVVSRRLLNRRAYRIIIFFSREMFVRSKYCGIVC